MLEKTLGDIARLTGGTLHHGQADAPCRGVCIDSRRITPGALYVPLQGARVDGHDFASSIQDTMAASLWKEGRPLPDFAVIVVKDPLEALQQLAAAYARELDACFIGVTGSNGKTSTKDWLASILSTTYRTQKTQGNHNNEIGVPLTLLELDPDCEMAIVEMGMEKPGEIDFLCSLVDLDMAAITSIGSAHLENFEDKSGIAAAKLEISHGLREGGPLFWPADSPELQELMREYSGPAISFSQTDSDMILDLEADAQGSRLKLEGEEYLVPASGFQALNAALAAGMARKLGVEPQQVQKGLEQASLTPHRGQRIRLGELEIIDDTYKSNPESAARALDFLALRPQPRKIAVLADMLDLGKDSEKLHAEIGRKARDMGIEVFAYGEEARAYTQRDDHYFQDKQALVDRLSRIEGPAALLVKGSNAMAMWEVIEALKEAQDGKE